MAMNHIDWGLQISDWGLEQKKAFRSQNSEY
jgi:hypothetical protein